MASYKMTESEDCECRYGIEAHNLEICHLGDILEDFLTDFCI